MARSYPFAEPGRLEIDPELTATPPLTRVKFPYGKETWLVTGHPEARAVLSDPRFVRTTADQLDEPRMGEHNNSPGILSLDAPQHTRLRKLVTSVFTVRRVQALRPRAVEIVDSLLDDLTPPADLVEGLARPFPMLMITTLLGVPQEDHEEFGMWADSFLSTGAVPASVAAEHYTAICDYLAALAHRRAEAPTDDLFGALVRCLNAGELTVDELVMVSFSILVGGLETVKTQLPNMVYLLLTGPSLLEELRADLSRLPAAVEEMLRYIPLPTTAVFARFATEDVPVGDVVIARGEPVLVEVPVTNRDPRVFADADSLDFARDPNPHLAFGHGAHYCLGAQLARLELQVALERLLTRMPALRLAVPEQELGWNRGYMVRGVTALPVTW
ncbi:cytochrome P450 [Lentzea roselyniae]|uniref:Cytochrome P450 n=1 Tax=Lentzea roselyniae TaxID=531940 RepID=A0ABP7C7M7_9PSEU